ncbi:hypothetical protein LVDJXP189_1400012 [Flavobacterium psychrophilum]|uniref:hypothetical protein n=1 Tax=Flavobacterium psychrophilum TaxID=96345 RepID=UPI000B7C4216|nr:hypothetical protein [Flavobacterium psychrophilum]MCB6062376.1 hypothetical protein [Flavobacterium psychrophilum]SNB42332.1 hypothetical protein LVDJXP189_1400012 [Flavobacterium psychrophilum]
MSKKIKFKIGEQYEKHEFDLDWVETIFENNLRYEVYQYIGKRKITIFGFEVQKTLLAYNCDFLAGIFYFIEFDKYPDLIEELNLKIVKNIESDNFKNCVLLSITSSKKNYVVVNSKNINLLIVSKHYIFN